MSAVMDAPANLELDAYKVRVATVAKFYAKQNGWCTVVDEALDVLEAVDSTQDLTEALTEVAARNYEDGRDAGYESGSEEGWDSAMHELKPFLSLTDEVLIYHDEHHGHVARFCSHVMCRVAWQTRTEVNLDWCIVQPSGIMDR